jgi:hypothetical protein
MTCAHGMRPVSAALLFAIALRGTSCCNETRVSTISASPATTSRTMVFCVHGGRAGSAFLATLSAMLPNITARHEHALTGASVTREAEGSGARGSREMTPNP